MEITAAGPVNRHITEYLTTTPGVKQYRCKTLQNPDYFYDGQAFAPVDVSATKDTVSGAGGIWLRDKGIVSFGCKKSDDAYKLFGLRAAVNSSNSPSRASRSTGRRRRSTSVTGWPFPRLQRGSATTFSSSLPGSGAG
jgi:hypothetical protein